MGAVADVFADHLRSLHLRGLRAMPGQLPPFARIGVLFHFSSHHVPLPLRLLRETLLFGWEACQPVDVGLELVRDARVFGGICVWGDRRGREDLERMVGTARRGYVSEG